MLLLNIQFWNASPYCLQVKQSYYSLRITGKVGQCKSKRLPLAILFWQLIKPQNCFCCPICNGAQWSKMCIIHIVHIPIKGIWTMWIINKTYVLFNLTSTDIISRETRQILSSVWVLGIHLVLICDVFHHHNGYVYLVSQMGAFVLCLTASGCIWGVMHFILVEPSWPTLPPISRLLSSAKPPVLH